MVSSGYATRRTLIARDWTELVAVIEGHYPTAVGSPSGQDNVLRGSLTKFANSLFKGIERMRRWSLAYNTAPPTVTSSGVQSYPFPSSVVVISRAYWLLNTGYPVTLELYDAQELRRMFGEGANAIPSAPRYYAINGTNLELFPVPDNGAAGNGAGTNYSIIIEGYGALTPIVETTGNTVAASPTLTVPSSAFLTARGLASAGSNVSVRGAGNLGALSAPDTLITNWTAFPLATTVTLATNAIQNTTNAQVFFNSLNWLIQDFDKVVLFGVLREVAAYLKENYSVWESRYLAELEEMSQFDFDRKSNLEKMATAVTGQRQAQLRSLDYPAGVEVRGGLTLG